MKVKKEKKKRSFNNILGYLLEPIIKPSDLGFLKTKSIWQIWVTLKKKLKNPLCSQNFMPKFHVKIWQKFTSSGSCHSMALSSMASSKFKLVLGGQIPFFLDKFPNI